MSVNLQKILNVSAKQALDLLQSNSICTSEMIVHELSTAQLHKLCHLMRSIVEPKIASNLLDVLQPLLQNTTTLSSLCNKTYSKAILHMLDHIVHLEQSDSRIEAMKKLVYFLGEMCDSITNIQVANSNVHVNHLCCESIPQLIEIAITKGESAIVIREATASLLIMVELLNQDSIYACFSTDNVMFSLFSCLSHTYDYIAQSNILELVHLIFRQSKQMMELIPQIRASPHTRQFAVFLDQFISLEDEEEVLCMIREFLNELNASNFQTLAHSIDCRGILTCRLKHLFIATPEKEHRWGQAMWVDIGQESVILHTNVDQESEVVSVEFSIVCSFSFSDRIGSVHMLLSKPVKAINHALTDFDPNGLKNFADRISIRIELHNMKDFESIKNRLQTIAGNMDIPLKYNVYNEPRDSIAERRHMAVVSSLDINLATDSTSSFHSSPTTLADPEPLNKTTTDATDYPTKFSFANEHCTTENTVQTTFIPPKEQKKECNDCESNNVNSKPKRKSSNDKKARKRSARQNGKKILLETKADACSKAPKLKSELPKDGDFMDTEVNSDALPTPLKQTTMCDLIDPERAMNSPKKSKRMDSSSLENLPTPERALNQLIIVEQVNQEIPDRLIECDSGDGKENSDTEWVESKKTQVRTSQMKKYKGKKTAKHSVNTKNSKKRQDHTSLKNKTVHVQKRSPNKISTQNSKHLGFKNRKCLDFEAHPIQLNNDTHLALELESSLSTESNGPICPRKRGRLPLKSHRNKNSLEDSDDNTHLALMLGLHDFEGDEDSLALKNSFMSILDHQKMKRRKTLENAQQQAIEDFRQHVIGQFSQIKQQQDDLLEFQKQRHAYIRDKIHKSVNRIKSIHSQYTNEIRSATKFWKEICDELNEIDCEFQANIKELYTQSNEIISNARNWDINATTKKGSNKKLARITRKLAYLASTFGEE